MDTPDFIALLDASGSELLAQADPQLALRLVDDERLVWGNRDADDVIVERLPEGDAADVLQWLKDQAEDLVATYYRAHPLSRNGFNRQVEALFGLFGAEAFAAPSGALPPFSLFVDGGTVVAEPATSARHRYGAFLEMNRQHGDVAPQVFNWLRSGEAYNQYLGMNVCRYNC